MARLARMDRQTGEKARASVRLDQMFVVLNLRSNLEAN